MIKTYSLSEIGVFIYAVVKSEQKDQVSDISNIYFGTNITKEGLEELLNSSKNNAKNTVKDKTGHQDEWHRLKKTMQGKK